MQTAAAAAAFACEAVAAAAVVTGVAAAAPAAWSKSSCCESETASQSHTARPPGCRCSAVAVSAADTDATAADSIFDHHHTVVDSPVAAGSTAVAVVGRPVDLGGGAQSPALRAHAPDAPAAAAESFAGARQQARRSAPAELAPPVAPSRLAPGRGRGSRGAGRAATRPAPRPAWP